MRPSVSAGIDSKVPGRRSRFAGLHPSDPSRGSERVPAVASDDFLHIFLLGLEVRSASAPATRDVPRFASKTRSPVPIAGCLGWR